jgi:beta-glucanase (GH16 family)
LTRWLSAGLAVVALLSAAALGTGPGGPGTARAAELTATAAPSVTVPKGWKLTFSSNFSGAKLNTKVWATCFWWAAPGAGCTNYGNGTEDKEWYLPSQVQLSGGVLHLVAQHQATAGRTSKGTAEVYSCRSGMVTTDPGFRFEYGLVQVTARIPYNTGLWSGLWLAAANHKWPPEIDILEHWDAQQQAKVYLHPTTGPRQGGPVFTPGNLSQGWHTFRIYWTKSLLAWYIDGVRVFATTTHIPAQATYLIMNLADVSTATGSCDGTLLVKSVKVWQP